MAFETYKQTFPYAQVIRRATQEKSKSESAQSGPDATVTWGEQTYEEMMVGFFDVAVAAPLDKPHYFIRKRESPQVH